MRKKLVRFVVVGVLLYLGYPSMAQKFDIQGGFLSDSLKIGETTAFYLSAHYPSNQTLIFPDSTFNFAPFEFQHKKYFTTRTAQNISHDSTIYYLTTFEIDRLQRLSLPAFVVNPKDCTIFYSQADSILITQLIPHPSDSSAIQDLPLKETTAYQNVLFLFNYPILLIVIGVFLLLALIIFLVFGKRIQKHFKAKKLQKKHIRFQESFLLLIQQLETSFSASLTESALAVWKKYMEQLDARPYTKLTTREMISIENNVTLGQHLQHVDRAVYGHDTNVIESLNNLKAFADERFSKKLEEVKHG